MSQTAPPLDTATDAKKSILESLWKTFKQTLESTTTALSSMSTSSTAAQEDSRNPYHTKQKEAISSRRVLLVEQTLQEHYTHQLVESSPHLDAYTGDPAIAAGKQQEARAFNNYRMHRALRWKIKSGNNRCHGFSESLGSHWSFQWCPQQGVYQGYRIKESFVLDNQYSLGSYWVPGTDINDNYAIYFAREVRAKFPSATVEIFHTGDLCDKSAGTSRDGQIPKNRRISAVVVHREASSRHCSEEMAGRLSGMAIESVEEPQVCKYVFHVCEPSEPKTEEEEKESMDSLDVESAPITESDAHEINQTMHYIHEVMHAYLHQTKADARAKANPDRTTSLHTGLPPLPPSRIEANRQLVKEMFMHAYDSYMYNAYPASEVKPISCKPAVFNLVKIPALTLIDSLDTLVILGNYTEFARSVERLRLLHKHMAEDSGMLSNGGLFALNQNVSVFETNIRVLGGLLSAHQMAEAYLSNKVREEEVWAEDRSVLYGRGVESVCKRKNDQASVNLVSEECATSPLLDCGDTRSEDPTCKNETVNYWKYNGFLLELAQDIGDRLLPAFQTPTGIPYGTVNLLSGIPKDETTIASLAGGGTLSLEMELLSRLTGNPDYGRCAKLAARALWMRKSECNLLGKHICTYRGDWTESVSGIGSNSDSFYEYLIKHYILFPEDEDFWVQTIAVYGGVHNESRLGEWYGDVDMFRGLSSGAAARRIFEALMAFYPGVQVLLGELTPAARSLNSFFLVREYLGFLPERFNYGFWRVDSSGGRHYLRPELLESAYFVHRATKGFQQQSRQSANSSQTDSSGWQWAADFALHTLDKTARTICGFASLHDLSPTTTGSVDRKKQEQAKNANLMDEMPSFFLSETLKYLYLTFDEDNILHTDEDREWVFTTEAHPICHVDAPIPDEGESKLESQKVNLINLLRSKVGVKKLIPQSDWRVLHEEKWTDLSPLHTFLHQLGSLSSSSDKKSRSRALHALGSDSGARFMKSIDLVEPFLSEEQVYFDLDRFGESQTKRNAAHLTFSKMGSNVDLTRSCPNFYSSEFLWVRALNGGCTDYSDAYVSSAQDEIAETESKFYMLGSVEALALHGTGVHPTQLYDKSQKCPAQERQKHKAQEESSKSEAKSKDRFDMGGDLGSFEVSAFPGGSGFSIQHMLTGESLITTLIDDESRKDKPETYVMVYSTKPAAETNDETTIGETTGQDVPDSTNEIETVAVAGSAQRAVIMADLKGNSFICQIEIIEYFVRQDDIDEISQVNGGHRAEREGDKVILATIPCAPALFGPTHLAELGMAGGVIVEAPIRTPVVGEEYGCSHVKRQQDVTPITVEKVGDNSPTATPHASDEGDSPVHLGKPDESSEGTTCLNKAVHVIHRGVCTFQEKSLHQKKSVSAEAVIIINSAEDELFVMSGGGAEDPEYLDNRNFPATVLVTGTDGEDILDIVDSFEPNETSQLQARVSLVPDVVQIVEAGTSFAVKDNKHWPVVRANTDALQIFAKGGWGVHAVQKNDKAKTENLEWQLYLMRHETAHEP